MEEAGRRWDAEAEIHRSYRYPNVSGWGSPSYDAQDRRRGYIGGTGMVVGHDTNPNDYESGIYNPKP